MSKANGSRPIERLAAALQDCLDEAADKAADKAAQQVKREMGPRFDKMDETLHMIWRQCGGKADQRLPIDD